MYSPKFIFLTLLVTLFSNVHAATIYDIQSGVSIYATQVVSSTDNFYDQNFNGDISSPYINQDALQAAVADGAGNLDTYAWTNVAHETNGNNGYITLSFNSSIYNGNGADLVLFFAGTGTKFQNGDELPFMFSIDVGGTSLNNDKLMGVISTTTVYNENDGIANNEYFASYAQIDLGLDYDQTTDLGDIRIYLGDSSMPALAALGAYHVTAVPLPLSAVLFTSGLAFLSLFRRKSKI